MTAHGDRKLRILQTMAAMLEDPAGEKITTAALAARLEVSEAALYRHFPSKARMFEGLIDFIENALFSVVGQIVAEEAHGLRQAELILAASLRFAGRNRGLTRLMIGDVLVHEHPRLMARINQLFERLEASLKQALKIAVAQKDLPAEHDCAAHADLLVCHLLGRLQRFVRSGFKDDPLSHWAAQWPLLAG
ncbi:nucleoid occlusion factor SlmA [Sulfuricystis multivorans]|uniref:nucleoid occlusion factor SlmA n=1 Tax=Sulfuricystis multivorans TaxID=2211108 RepID=UPI000F81A92E|nr:nucleoid occlusion factor SlmA [Sulfuricystis multivorans]